MPAGSRAALICDTGALIDYLVESAPDHERFREAIDQAAVTDVDPRLPRDLCDPHARVRELVRKYADRPRDLADACLVAMSEKWWGC